MRVPAMQVSAMADARTIAVLFVCLVTAGCATDAIDLAPASPQTPYQETGLGPAVRDTSRCGRRGKAGTTVSPRSRNLAILRPPPESDEQRIYGLPELIDLAEVSNPSTPDRVGGGSLVGPLSVGEVEAAYLPSITATVVGRLSADIEQYGSLAHHRVRCKPRAAREAGRHRAPAVPAPI